MSGDDKAEQTTITTIIKGGTTLPTGPPPTMEEIMGPGYRRTPIEQYIKEQVGLEGSGWSTLGMEGVVARIEGGCLNLYVKVDPNGPVCISVDPVKVGGKGDVYIQTNPSVQRPRDIRNGAKVSVNLTSLSFSHTDNIIKERAVAEVGKQVTIISDLAERGFGSVQFIAAKGEWSRPLTDAEVAHNKQVAARLAELSALMLKVYQRESGRDDLTPPDDRLVDATGTLDISPGVDMLDLFNRQDTFNISIATLPNQEEVVERAKVKLGTDKLTWKQAKDALAEQGIYKAGKFIVRTYKEEEGYRTIRVDSAMFPQYLEQEAETVKQLSIPGLEGKKPSASAPLGRIAMTPFTHRVKTAIALAAAKQHGGKWKEVYKTYIPHNQLMDILGYKYDDSTAYKMIDDAILTLRNIEIIDEVVGKNGKEIETKKTRFIGDIFHYSTDGKSYEYCLAVSGHFIAAGVAAAGPRPRTKEEREERSRRLKGRRFIGYPSAALSITRNLSGSVAYSLFDFLIKDRGNVTLSRKDRKNKVLKYAVHHYIDRAYVRDERVSQRKKTFLAALAGCQRVGLIVSLRPTLADLLDIRPGKLMNTQLTIRVPKNHLMNDHLLTPQKERAKEEAERVAVEGRWAVRRVAIDMKKQAKEKGGKVQG